MAKSTFVYVTYIRTTPEKLWSALTDNVEFMQQYWFGVYCDSDWKAGSPWRMVMPTAVSATRARSWKPIRRGDS